MEFNSESVEKIADNIISILSLCNENKSIWLNDKAKMLRMIEQTHNDFYEKYPRICITLVREKDISPLLGMLYAFGKVQSGEVSVDKANESITNALNATYINPTLNSDKLVKERERKMKEEENNNN